MVLDYRYVIGGRSGLDRGCPIYGASPSDEGGNNFFNPKKNSGSTPKQLSRVYRESIGTNGPNGALVFPLERISQDIWRIPFTLAAISEKGVARWTSAASERAAGGPPTRMAFDRKGAARRRPT